MAHRRARFGDKAGAATEGAQVVGGALRVDDRVVLGEDIPQGVAEQLDDLALGQREQAVGEFRHAIFSPTSGYTRTNLELARVLLELGRPREAVSILQPALRGPLEASSLYVTRTELHELLGRAWETAGEPDSAAVHYQRVLDAWRSADPEFHACRDSVRGRLSALRR